jgi:hypothetical protein
MFKYVLLLIVLVVGLGGAGYYNYQRNAAMDADLLEPRPYRAVPSADLAKIIASTQKDVARRKGSIASAPHGASAIDAKDASDVGGRANAFAGFQRENERWKNERGAMMEQEVLLKQLQHEKELRDKDLDPMSRIKRRADLL